MIKIWFSLIVVFTIQEVTSTALVMLEAERAGFTLVSLGVLWIAISVIEIIAGFFIGKWVRNRFPNSRIAKWAAKWATRWEEKGRQGVISQ